MGTELHTLAPELVDCIAGKLVLGDLKALRATCSRLGKLLSAQLFATTYITLSQHDMNASKLRLLPKSCNVVESAQTLVIGSLAPTYNAKLDKVWDFEVDALRDSRARAAERIMKKHLFKAILSLERVRTVRWRPVCKDPIWAQQSVVNALMILPNLSHLDVDLSGCKIDPPLRYFPPLQSLSISGLTGCPSTKEIFTHLSKLIAHSPELSSISIDVQRTYGEQRASFASLHRLLKYAPKETKDALKIRSLNLQNVVVHASDEISFAHLRYLTSLTYTKDPSPSRPTIPTEGSTLSPNPASPLLQSSPPKPESKRTLTVWDVLAREEIFLEEIITDRVPDALLAYLESYSGLKKLDLATRGLLNESESDAAGIRFYKSALSQHVETLQELSVKASYEGSWCFSVRNSGVIGLERYQALRELGISVISRQLAGQPHNVMKALLDQIGTALPKLDLVKVAATKAEEHRQGDLATANKHIFFAQRNIRRAVENYDHDLLVTRLPEVHVAGVRYVAVEQSGLFARLSPWKKVHVPSSTSTGLVFSYRMVSSLEDGVEY